MKILSILLSMGVLGLLTGCQKEFLDTRIDTNQTEETLSSNYATLFSYANAPYTFLRNEFTMLDNNLFSPVSDETVQTTPGNSNVLFFNNGSWNAISNPDNYYAGYYSGIRAANFFLENSANYRAQLAINRDTISVSGKTNYRNDVLNIGWYRAEARVLRAWYYAELIKRYGGVPLVTRTLGLQDNINLPRASYDEVVSFIVGDLDRYKDSLQVNWKTSSFTNNDGRVSKGMALALKARTLLYAASPLNNPSGDVARWRAAAAAANEMLVFAAGAGQYTLDNNYRDYFLRNNTLTSGETIWAIRYPASSDPERRNYPIATAGGASGLTPTQDLVEAYEYKGKPDSLNPYANRDPRLGLSIVTNNSSWNGRTIDQSAGGTDDRRKTNASRTGYYLKKFLADGLNLVQNQTVVHNWPVFRFADVLLMYAEAMNEAYGPDNANGYTLTARQALNRVRSRSGVGMPDVTVTSPVDFRAAVRRERRVELAFENHRYWDLLRWKQAATVLNSSVKGVSVSKTGGTFIYTPITVENRVFDASKMYLYPIPQVEINKSNGVLNQNPGW
ncbi:RagB/SusD family nutrient uptake outer membrane protein [Siphonobacter sp. BAB-5385]|uniref:RagB/SusD family nutrient uptake outer membrane protein n=2 Tax=unclassified Siphonobacter TaxID=2635712 RepID=UPI000B9E7541|nr:RagB/SusD family nutrient uptake outer membrane protein [Siphonobacter sp. BAB-5385]OZI07043.1 RagB/SusD family nutrient uptake outer membrane protein [Siphonobacter sp. BAB-5385]